MKKNIYLLFIATTLITVENFAAIINVPNNYPTIQTAIVASGNGDTVLVEPGTYFENINFRGKKIVLTSRFYLIQDTGFICSTIINGSQPADPDTGSCIILNSNEDSTTIIQGFTITGGKGTKWLDIHGAGTYREGGGILTEFSSPVIRWNHIVDNIVTNAVGVSSTGGGGIRSGDGSPHIYNNVIAYNQARYGGGIVINYCNNAEIKNNIIVQNSGGQSFGGGGLWATGVNTSTVLTVENNTIANNHVSGTGSYGGQGGGIFVFSITLNTKNNIIWGNTQNTGNSITKYFGGVVNANYSDIDFFYNGTDNINTDPLFADTTLFLLSSNSPCIDSGDSSTWFNDITNTPNIAEFPSQGSERNDMGAYGGPLARIYPNCNLNSTSISEINSSNFYSISPNPSTGIFTINSSKNQPMQIEIFSVLGEIVLNQKTESNKAIALNELPNGFYYLRITSDKNKSVIKNIIINK